MCGKYEGIFGKYEEICGKYEEICEEIICGSETQKVESSCTGFSLDKCSGTWKNSGVSPHIGCGTQENFELSPYIGCGTWKNSEFHPQYRPWAQQSEACESSYIAFFLYKYLGTWKNFELHPLYWTWDFARWASRREQLSPQISALGLRKIPGSPLIQAVVHRFLPI